MSKLKCGTCRFYYSVDHCTATVGGLWNVDGERQ